MLKQKVVQKVIIILGYFILSKNHNEPPKVAQLAKIAQSGHPVCIKPCWHNIATNNARHSQASALDMGSRVVPMIGQSKSNETTVGNYT